MAKIDYNSNTFRNEAIDRFQGKFGQPTKRSASASSSTLANPFQQKTPLSQGLGDTSVKRPAAPKAPAAKPVEKKPTALTSETKAPVAAPSSLKDAKQKAKIAVAEAKGKAKVAKLEAKGSKSTEDKMELRQKRAENLGKAVKGTMEVVGTGLGLYGTYQGIKRGSN